MEEISNRFPDLDIPGITVSVDEAGRGCLAGPVSVGLVCFSKETLLKIQKGECLSGLRDSKKCSPSQRDRLFQEIQNLAYAWRVEFVSQKFIDSRNINQAIFYGIQKGIRKMGLLFPHLLVDGNYRLPAGPYASAQSIVKGDDRIASISAASILAKTARDRFMVRQSKKFPKHGFEKHKGYGTEIHRQAIQKVGTCRLHRLSFLSKIRQDFYDPGLFSSR